MKLTAVLIGAGGRGYYAYAPYAQNYPHELEFVAVAEPDPVRRQLFADCYGIAQQNVFADWQEALSRSKMADVVFICTQDRMHFDPTMMALRQGYHVLLEKPISPEAGECLLMEQEAALQQRILTVCHVLRFTPFWSQVKAVLQEGAIGEIVSVQLNENVGYFHMAHSFVRGNWRHAAQSSPMILAKSCHDMDLLSWLVDRECTRISSFGSLMHFRPEHAPENSAQRCTDGCLAESTCPYAAPRFYLGDGREWAKFITTDLSNPGIIHALQEGPYGRCVYRCDNDVVDHQVVNAEFAGGATALFSMCGFTRDSTRHIQIMGTKGEIRGFMEQSRFVVFDFLTHRETEVKVHAPGTGHHGGDEGLVRSFLREVRELEGTGGIYHAKSVIQGHMMCFAAEESRVNGGKTVVMSDYRKNFG